MENEEQQHLKRLEVITQDLNRLESNVKKLDCDAEMLKATVGQMDETTGAKKLAELQKRALVSTEELVRKMLDLDSLSGEKVRPLRREQVTRVQNVLRTIDEEVQKHLKEIERVVTKNTSSSEKEENNDGPIRRPSRNQRRKQRRRAGSAQKEKEVESSSGEGSSEDEEEEIEERQDAANEALQTKEDGEDYEALERQKEEEEEDPELIASQQRIEQIQGYFNERLAAAL